MPDADGLQMDLKIGEDPVSLPEIYQICENSPSVLSEGKFMEVYTMENVNVQVVIRNILDENKKPETDYRYSNGSWLKTPASDEIKAFVKKQLYQENPICYNENQLLKLLSENNNYFILIKQKIGPSILLLWDVKSERLYMLSSEDL